MNTLRDFAASVVPAIKNSTKPKFYNKPDSLSALFELRRITANRHAGSFKTDYFEYYWAHFMQGTKVSDVVWWIWKLLCRSPKEIPTRLKWIYFFFWGSCVVVLGLLATTTLFYFLTNKLGVLSNQYWKVITGLLLLVVNYFIIEYLGDAARYMTPKPRNIAERQVIRKNGLDLLTKLHSKQENGKRKYDRIIVVGHSLGSVIAYDLLNLYWNRVHAHSQHLPASCIEELEAKAQQLESNAITLETFRKAQFSVWKRQQPLPKAWLVSDFITIGSPLAHGPLLLAKNYQTFEAKKHERELPTCPPIQENKDRQPHFSYIETNGKRVLHHAAAFSMTRWTNLYFRNDYVGGPIINLGKGIENKEMVPRSTSFLRARRVFPFLSHTCYWDASETESASYIRTKMELIIPSSQDSALSE
jgi:hypothetical protein